MSINSLSRRDFTKTTGKAMAGSIILPIIPRENKKRIALVGTGVRGTSMWGRFLQENYRDRIEFVGLCDINPGRLEYARKYMKVDCETFTDFEQMMKRKKPEMLIVTTVDATHHEFIIKGMEMGADVITEKPLTTDEQKCQAILDAEKRTGRKVRVTFNYRFSPHRQTIYELLRDGAIGDIVSCDFHWYLDIYHGASYFRRWHGLRNKGGSLLVHKATHHFDLLNWWLESEPEEVFAYGDLEHYGKNNSFRHTHCRPCPHKSKCAFHWDITKSERDMKLYVNNEKHDGYLRDGCLWREEIDIFDKMAAQIHYANNVNVSYSLTTYSPYEGYRIAFNGTKGRLEAWIKERQPWIPDDNDFDEIRVTENFGYSKVIQVPHGQGGHGGGDTRMLDKIFRNPDSPDPWRQSAGLRDGAMSILLGIAARNSIDEKRPVKIAELTELVPMAVRP